MEDKKELIRKRAFEIFELKCRKMIDSKFLLAQPCIEAVLKCIIASPELYQFIKESVSNIDLENELIKATGEHPGKPGVVLPVSKRLIVALVTYLLNQFDNNELDLMEFISYYYDQDTNIGYQVFSREVIVPYIDAVRDLFLYNVKDTGEEIHQEEKIVNAVIHEQADDIIKNLITSIQGDNSLSDVERNEMTALAEGMMIALVNLDRKVIIALWIAFKHIINRSRKLLKINKELEKLLKDYLII